MAEPVDKDVCLARYVGLCKDVKEIKDTIQQIFGRMNTFYVTLIFVLLTQLTIVVYSRRAPKVEPPINITISKEAIK